MNDESQPAVGSPPQATPGAGSRLSESDVRMWSMLCHLAALVGLLLPSFGAVLGPLVAWLLRRNDHPAIDANGKESLNFQLSILLYTWVLGGIGAMTVIFLVGFLFLAAAFVIGILGLVGAVVAAIKVSNGHPFRYPCTIRFLA